MKEQATSPEEREDARATRAGDPIVDRHGRLVRRTLLVSGLTLASRMLGFVREVLAAALFGDRSAIFDAFLTAWRVPNLFRRFLGEGAISTALQTRLTEVDADAGEAAGRRLFLGTLRLLGWILWGVCLGMMALVWWMPDRMPFTGWRWLGSDPEPVRELTLRLLPFVVLICPAALCAGALQVRGHFRAPALAPVVMNLVWIATLVFLALEFGWSAEADPEGEFARQFDMARWLAWGVVAAGTVQLAVQVPALARHGLLFPRTAGEPSPSPGAPRTRPWDVLKTSAPLAFGAAVYQINVMVDGLMAEGLLADGGPTAHYLANRVQQFPLALIAIAATSSVFPALKALGHRGRGEELRALHDRTQFAVLFLALPASFGLFVLARPIATVLFENGSYGSAGVARLAAALAVLAWALLPAGAVGLVSRTYYAVGDLRTPVRVSIGMLGLNALLNVAFVSGLGMDADGLALATAVTSWGNLFLLLPGLTRLHGLESRHEGVGARLVRLLAAGLASGGAALAVHALFTGGASFPMARASSSVVALVAAGLAGILAFVVAAALLALPEWSDLKRRLGKR